MNQQISPEFKSILDRVKSQHEQTDAEWQDWRDSPEGIAAILQDTINGIPPSERSVVRLKRLLNRLQKQYGLPPIDYDDPDWL